MDETMKIAYAEVSQVVETLGNDYKNKIPRTILKVIEEKKDNNHKINVTDDNLSRVALIIISILNLKYWEKDENQINFLKEKYYENERKYQELINAYKKPDWLKKDNNNFENISNNNTSLIVKKERMIDKVIRFFKKFIGKGE